jgi:hypothetical protein
VLKTHSATLLPTRSAILPNISLIKNYLPSSEAPACEQSEMLLACEDRLEQPSSCISQATAIERSVNVVEERSEGHELPMIDGNGGQQSSLVRTTQLPRPLLSTNTIVAQEGNIEVHPRRALRRLQRSSDALNHHLQPPGKRRQVTLATTGGSGEEEWSRSKVTACSPAYLTCSGTAQESQQRYEAVRLGMIPPLTEGIYRQSLGKAVPDSSLPNLHSKATGAVSISPNTSGIVEAEA